MRPREAGATGQGGSARPMSARGLRAVLIRAACCLASPAAAQAPAPAFQPPAAQPGTLPAPKMPDAMQDRLDSLMIERYGDCFTFDGPPEDGYIPVVLVSYARNGALSEEPIIVDPPLGPGQMRVAAAALKALHRCDPLPIPAAFAPYYAVWHRRVLRFDPQALQPAPAEKGHAATMSAPPSSHGATNRTIDGRGGTPP